MKETKKIIEALIFTSRSPVSAVEMKGILPAGDSAGLNVILAELVEEWSGLGRAFELVKTGGGYQFRTKSDYAGDIIRFNKQIKKLRLSKAALEVLAISAYEQPLTKADVEEIRGLDSSAVVNLLVEKQLLEICGRKEVPGRPFLYKTTDEFLSTFGINKLSDLPTLQEIEEAERDLGADPEGIISINTQKTADETSESGNETENP